MNFDRFSRLWKVLFSSVFLCGLAALGTGVFAAPAAPAPSGGRMHRVVIEVSVPGTEDWKAILNNVDNLLKEFGASRTRIEVVAHGKGLGLLLKTDTALAGRIAGEARQGVVFAACRNTMRAQHVTSADLLPTATTVPSGVGEVIMKQEAGWSYLKGGF